MVVILDKFYCTQTQSFPLPDVAGNVTVMTLRDYLHTHLSSHAELHTLHESITESVGASQEGGRGKKQEYTQYLPDNLIVDGLQKVCICIITS